MKKRICFFAALGLIFSLAACSPRAPVDTQPSSGQKEMPEVMKEMQNDENLEWMSGIWLDVTNSTCLRSATGREFALYANPNGPIEVTVTVQNGMDVPQPYFLVVLADGVPTAFTIEGEAYTAYPLDLTPEQTALHLTLSPEFSLNLGRLDFLLFFDGDPRGDFHMGSDTIWIDLEEDPQRPTALRETADQRSGLRGTFSGSSFSAWLWNQGVFSADSDWLSQREMSIAAGEALLLEAVIGEPGMYRMVLFLNGKPVSFLLDGEAHTYLDWESHGTDMLQIPIAFPENTAIGGSFFAVLTPLNPQLRGAYSLASWKTEITQKGED